MPRATSKVMSEREGARIDLVIPVFPKDKHYTMLYFSNINSFFRSKHHGEEDILHNFSGCFCRSTVVRKGKLKYRLSIYSSERYLELQEVLPLL